MTSPRSTITLRALQGEPLRDARIRDIVIATAHAIAERNGIEIMTLSATDDSISVELGVHRLAALGFAAELRRLTTNWHAHKSEGERLWGDPIEPDEQRDPRAI